MKRREFITLMGGAAMLPLAVRAQQPAMPVIGYLSGRSLESDAHFVAAFRSGVSDLGYIEGQNVTIRCRFAEGRLDRLRSLAADLVRDQVAVLAAIGDPAALAAKQATSTIPIVFTAASDPMVSGLVASLSRPGGNATGLTSFGTPLASKRLALLRELVPRASTIAVLVNPDNVASFGHAAAAQTATLSLGLQMQIMPARNEGDFDTAFAAMSQQRVGALLVSPDSLYLLLRQQLVAVAARHGLPAIYDRREYVAAGGLMSYGVSFGDYYRLLGAYAARILRGEKPEELPVQQPTKFELVVNLKTAQALGLTMPNAIQLLADEIIE